MPRTTGRGGAWQWRITGRRTAPCFRCFARRGIACPVEVPSPHPHTSPQMRPRIFLRQLAQRLRSSVPAVNLPALVRTTSRAGMRRTVLSAGACAAVASLLTGCARDESAPGKPLLIFAAANMRDALNEIARQHRDAGGDSAVLVFGSTGDLATQIANGAPADLFFSANTEAIDQLAAKGHVDSATRAVYAIGRLAVVARCTRADTAVGAASAASAATADAADNTADSAHQTRRCPRLDLVDLLNDSLRTVAIADPSHAPYGRAAQQALERSGMWDAIRERLVFGANISQAELFVTSGNADAGIVALSVLQRAGQSGYTLVDTALHDALRQALAVTSRTQAAAQAQAFIGHVLSDSGRAVLQRYGFQSPPTAAPLANGH